MSLYARLIQNHPLANIAFAVVLAIGMLAYLAMPREQDPEINFNWVTITTVLPGASAEDVEKRVTKPLEDAIKGVADIRFVMSSSRENIATILVRFRDIGERTFDKRINDLRREIQNKAKSELPSEAEDPQVIEITTSNGFPTAMVLVTGQAADELLRSRSRQFKDDLERIAGVDQVFATGLRDPELQVEFDPVALANRGLTAADVADSANAWFRDTFAGKPRDGAIAIRADADVYVGRLDAGGRISHRTSPTRGIWIHVFEGSIGVGGAELAAGDGASIEDVADLAIGQVLHRVLFINDDGDGIEADGGRTEGDAARLGPALFVLGEGSGGGGHVAGAVEQAGDARGGPEAFERDFGIGNLPAEDGNQPGAEFLPEGVGTLDR